MTRKAPEIIEVNSQQFEEILERASSNTLRDEDTELMRERCIHDVLTQPPAMVLDPRRGLQHQRSREPSLVSLM